MIKRIVNEIYELEDKKNYPGLLSHLPEEAIPKKLWFRGKSPPVDNKYLCIVGSRSCTPYGKEACRYIISGLKGYPITIVSGLAIGMDSHAHKCALEENLNCIAFPGSGLEMDVLYPSSSKYLAEEIILSDGAVYSEFPPEAKSQPWMFPLRNRLMVGVSHAVLFIEAREKSGTNITFRLSAEFSRDALAVPGSIFSVHSEGTNRMIYEGATPILSGEDVLKWFGFI